jgi:hypothetical protein
LSWDGYQRSKYPLFSVIHLPVNSRNFENGKPFIVTHSIASYGLAKDGNIKNYKVDDFYTFINKTGLFSETIATPEEVRFCIENLTDAQWRTIMINAAFNPIMEAVGDMDLEIVENQPVMQ